MPDPRLPKKDRTKALFAGENDATRKAVRRNVSPFMNEEMFTDADSKTEVFETDMPSLKISPFAQKYFTNLPELQTETEMLEQFGRDNNLSNIGTYADDPQSGVEVSGQTTPVSTGQMQRDMNGWRNLPKGSTSAGNMGYLAGQQEILNKLIAQDTNANKPQALNVDDILGNKTRAAMDYYEAQGLYMTPALYLSENVEQYKKNWAKMSPEQKKSAASKLGNVTLAEQVEQTVGANKNPFINVNPQPRKGPEQVMPPTPPSNEYFPWLDAGNNNLVPESTFVPTPFIEQKQGANIQPKAVGGYSGLEGYLQEQKTEKKKRGDREFVNIGGQQFMLGPDKRDLRKKRKYVAKQKEKEEFDRIQKGINDYFRELNEPDPFYKYYQEESAQGGAVTGLGALDQSYYRRWVEPTILKPYNAYLAKTGKQDTKANRREYLNKNKKTILKESPIAKKGPFERALQK